ncbi:MAG TPA: 2-dehydro-3-deoxyphosphogluconate aldolase [Clostridiales bacterium]|nr:2-dehydro-3-deoxyphosphogluconate aldolase [Clostridiales bacterium]
MQSPELVRERIERAGVMAILRRVPEARLEPAVEALWRGGVRVAEVTWDDESSPDLLARAMASSGDDSLWGMGTVTSARQVRRALAAGARFIVTPVFVPEVVEECRRQGVLCVPGAFSPTEVHAAWRAGGGLIKVFPAAVLGAPYFRHLRGPFPGIPLLAVGGVSADNAGSFLRAGAVAVGAGGELVRRDLIERGDWEALAEGAGRFVAAVEEARSPCSR